VKKNTIGIETRSSISLGFGRKDSTAEHLHAADVFGIDGMHWQDVRDGALFLGWLDRRTEWHFPGESAKMLGYR